MLILVERIWFQASKHETTYSIVETEKGPAELAVLLKSETESVIREKYGEAMLSRWSVGAHVNDPNDDDLPPINVALARMEGVKLLPTITVSLFKK